MMDRVEPVHVDPRGHVISTLFSSLFINNGTNDRELVGKKELNVVSAKRVKERNRVCKRQIKFFKREI